MIHDVRQFWSLFQFVNESTEELFLLLKDLFQALDVIPTMLRINKHAKETIDASGTLQGLGITMVSVQRKEDQEAGYHHLTSYIHVLPGSILLHNVLMIRNVNGVPMVANILLLRIVRRRLMVASSL